MNRAAVAEDVEVESLVYGEPEKLEKLRTQLQQQVAGRQVVSQLPEPHYQRVLTDTLGDKPRADKPLAEAKTGDKAYGIKKELREQKKSLAAKGEPSDRDRSSPSKRAAPAGHEKKAAPAEDSPRIDKAEPSKSEPMTKQPATKAPTEREGVSRRDGQLTGWQREHLVRKLPPTRPAEPGAAQSRPALTRPTSQVAAQTGQPQPGGGMEGQRGQALQQRRQAQAMLITLRYRRPVQMNFSQQTKLKRVEHDMLEQRNQRRARQAAPISPPPAANERIQK